MLLSHNILVASELSKSLALFPCFIHHDVFIDCWKKKKIAFLQKIFYFSTCLTSNKLYWIEDQPANISTRFYGLASWRWRVEPSAT